MARGATSIFCNARSVRRQPAFSPLDKSRRVFLFAFLSLVVLASACAIFYIGTHIQAVNLGYNIGQELQRKESLIEENKRLSLEIARLKSPTRIETEAKETLGLTLPKTQQVFYLSRLESDTLVKFAGAAPLTPPEGPAKLAAAEPNTAKPRPVAAPAEAHPSKTEPPGTHNKIAAAAPKASNRSAEATAANPAPKTLASKGAAPAAAPDPRSDTPASRGASSGKSKDSAAKLAQSEQPGKHPAPAAGTVAKVPAAKSDLAASAPKPAAATSAPATPAKIASAGKPKTEVLASADKSKAAAGAKAPQRGAEPRAAGSEAPKQVAQQDKAPAPAKKVESGKNATAKNDLGKPTAPKSSAKEKAPDLKVAKGEDSDVLVAKIVSREPTRDKGAVKLKSGPSLAYQPKDKVPAVMLDPMP